MDCNDFFPVFLLYNKKVLTGFGFTANGAMDSHNLEHPKADYFKV